jgi:outer membrane protein
MAISCRVDGNVLARLGGGGAWAAPFRVLGRRSKMSGIRRFGVRVALAGAVAALSVFGPPAVQAQTPPPTQPQPPPFTERRLSMTDAVELALKQNADLDVVRIVPLIQDTGIDLAKSNWVPSLNSTFFEDRNSSPPNSFLSGGQTKIQQNQSFFTVGIGALLPFGSSYNIGWDNYRSTTNNAFANFSPQYGSNLAFNFTQPLLRNFGVDSPRQQLQVSRKNREISDEQVREAVTTTTRQVRNAYWDLVFSRSSLEVAQQSLDLAQRSLKENRARVEIGTMAPIDIVQAEAEVAQREEAVIIADAAIGRAEDALRALIFGRHLAAEWNARLIPTDPAVYTEMPVDIDSAVRASLDTRTDLLQAQKTIEANDMTIRFLRNQILPDLIASVDYGAVGIGGTQLVRGDGFPGDVIDTIKKPYSDVLQDVVGAQFPSWTFTVQFSYPLGTAPAEANLARARLQNQQSARQLDAARIRAATEIREMGRTVTANSKRVDATRAARTLADKRLEAEEKKFQAGMTTSFFVLQAQRDLNQARNNELQALIDYLKSVVDWETSQIAPLGASPFITVVTGGGVGSAQSIGLQQQQQNQQQQQQRR